MSTLIRCSYVNQTRGHMIGEEDEWTESDWGFRELSREFGRCVGRIYRDNPDGPPTAVGYVFVKRMQYEDARNNGPDSFYIREVWAEVRTYGTMMATALASLARADRTFHGQDA